MSSPAEHPLFSVFGVELEYMIVDAGTLEVRPIADEILRAPDGAITGEVDRERMSWSNELVAHVVELKVGEPVRSLEGLGEAFQSEVREINARLSPFGARLLPGGVHPWMDPLRDTRLWVHEYNEVYGAFDRIFGCQGHGWANLQSVHLNLPFTGDEEFGRLHAAIRLVLPILPALTASSPVIDGRMTGILDNRLEVYRTNSRKIPSIAGRVIPEPVFSRTAYEEQILNRLYADIAPYDPEGLLRHEWLNARGAIARFQRNTIEIRVMDVQECPEADVAICAAVVALLEGLVAGRICSWEAQQSFGIDRLEKILLGTIRDADRSLIHDTAYLDALGYPGSPCTAGELWRRLIERLRNEEQLAPSWQPALDVLLMEGPLARRLTTVLEKTGFSPENAEPLRNLYGTLGDCLEQGKMLRL